MNELHDFLNENFPDGVQITTPQFERTEKLDFEWKPSNYHEFITTVTKAPWEILKGLGFGKWDTMNNCIRENAKKPVVDKISIPIINAPNGETLDMDLGRGNHPVVELEIDEDIILFPAEWYDIIPDGFIVTGLWGESYPFEKDKTSKDRRFGCLCFGIRKPLNPHNHDIDKG